MSIIIGYNKVLLNSSINTFVPEVPIFSLKLLLYKISPYYKDRIWITVPISLLNDKNFLICLSIWILYWEVAQTVFKHSVSNVSYK